MFEYSRYRYTSHKIGIQIIALFFQYSIAAAVVSHSSTRIIHNDDKQCNVESRITIQLDRNDRAEELTAGAVVNSETKEKCLLYCYIAVRNVCTIMVSPREVYYLLLEVIIVCMPPLQWEKFLLIRNPTMVAHSFLMVLLGQVKKDL